MRAGDGRATGCLHRPPVIGARRDGRERLAARGRGAPPSGVPGFRGLAANARRGRLAAVTPVRPAGPLADAGGPTSAAGVEEGTREVPPATRVAARPDLGATDWRRTTYLAAATQALTLIGFGLSIPFLPLYAQALGVRDPAELALWSGVLAGAAALPMAFLAPVWGAVADRYGRKLMLVRSMLGGAFLMALMGGVETVWQLLGLRLGQGALTGSQAAASALVAAAAPARQVGFAVGLVNTAIQIGNSIGPAIGGIVVGSLGYRGSFVLGGILLGLGGLIALVFIKEPPRPTRGGGGQAVVARESGGWPRRSLRPFGWPGFRSLLMLQAGTQFAFSANFALLPLYLLGIARPAWLTAELASGLALGITAVASAAATTFLGHWADRHGPHGLLQLSLLGTMASLIPQALIPNVWLLLALRVPLGLGIAGLVASTSILIRSAAPAGREGAAYGANAAAQAFGWALGPILGSVVAAIAGIPTLYVLGALVVGAFAPVMRRERA